MMEATIERTTTFERTASFLTAVPEGGVIILPADFPVGATIVVSLVSNRSLEYAEEARKARFAASLSLIEEAAKKPPVEISDEELNKLIKEARKSTSV